MKSLFVTYNGLADQIGISQIVPYLSGISEHGHSISAISFESPDRLSRFGGEIFARLRQDGVVCHPETFGEGILAKFLDQSRLRTAMRKVMANEPFDLIHCRSYAPLSAVLAMHQRLRTPFLFDMRGFWIDQRIEGGRWNPRNPFYRILIERMRGLERMALSRAGHIVVLTDDARRHVERQPGYRGAGITTIPCSVDFETFNFDPVNRLKQRGALGFDPDDIILTYLGSVGSVYLTDKIFRLYSILKERRKPVKLLFVGRHGVDKIVGLASEAGVVLDREDLRCVESSHDDVPQYLSASDIGLCFISPTFSSTGVSATKVGEYLACGLPVLANKGIGDIDAIIEEGRNGFVLPDFSDKSLNAAADLIARGGWNGRAGIREAAAPRYDMKLALAAYDTVYKAFEQ